MQKISFSEIEQQLKGEGIDAIFIENNKSIEIEKLNYIYNSSPNSLHYSTETNIESFHLTDVTLVCGNDIDDSNKSINYIKVDDPKIGFYIIAQLFNSKKYTPGIHPSAIVHPDAKVHNEAYIGPNCVIEENVIIKKGSVLHANSIVYSNSVIEENVTIESNSSIGASGLFWTWGKNGKMWQLPFRGSVNIQSNCFIGTDVSIVRGCFDDDVTTIGANSKIAHGTKVGHDCKLGFASHIANNVSLGGKVILEDRCFLGSGVTIKPGSRLAKDTIVGTGAVVTKNFLNEKQTLVGVPAKEMARDNSKPSGMHSPHYQVVKGD